MGKTEAVSVTKSQDKSEPVKATKVDPTTRNFITTQYPSMGDVSDGFHTFNELYRQRMLYNAAFFNQLAGNAELHEIKPPVKSKKHSDGELCFGGGWFIVVAELPTGQISQHYKEEYWPLFKLKVEAKAPAWDGHTPEQACDRLEAYLKRGI